MTKAMAIADTTERASPAEPLLLVENLSVNYHLPNGTFSGIVKEISFRVNEGEVIAILGPSGCGKSTILKCIVGLVKPTGGRIFFKGKEVSGVTPGIAMIFQTTPLLPWLTVLDNVLLGLKSKNIPRKEAMNRVRDVLTMIGLNGFEHAYPKELSSSMKQRVGFATAFVTMPELLLMDEPFSQLDALTAENLRGELMDLHLAKKIPAKSIILITNDIEEAVMTADRILVLSKDPARIIDEIPITIPHKRDKTSAEFVKMVDRVYSSLLRQVEESRPEHEQEEDKLPPIPAAKPGAVIGLTNIISEMGGRVELSVLGSRQALDLATLMPLIEATKQLGLIEVIGRTIVLTEAGMRVSQAPPAEQKEIIGAVLLASVPLFQHVVKLLYESTSTLIPAEPFMELLTKQFGKELARTQWGLLIGWGRYGGILNYDGSKNCLSLDPSFHLPDEPA